jgi:HTH-type transcriptional regulator/antitoxin HigA
MKKIQTDAQHNAALKKVDMLMKKGEANTSPEESAEIRALALEIQAYEKKRFYVAPPKTLAGIIELRMYEMRLNQAGMAKKLGVSTAKLSLILNNKQRPDVALLKAIHTKLKVDGDFILQHV